MEEVRISYLDGPRLRRSVLAGAQWVIERQRHLDDINVFPVPDSDTGTNMASTMREIASLARDAVETSIGRMSARIAEAALMGARGNSGAILAQFFSGLADGLHGHDRIGTHAFGGAATVAALSSFEAVAQPVEGTILTVIRAWADHVGQRCSHSPDFVELLRGALEHARTALARTTEQMQSLKAAGVVDAGAQGFVYLLEGINALIERGSRSDEALAKMPASDRQEGHGPMLEPPAFRYCTECLLEGSGLEKAALRATLAPLGDSVVIAGSRRQVRVHIHSDQPATVFARLAKWGRVHQEKVDDLRQQVRDLRHEDKRSIAVVTDTGCDLPRELLERHNIHRVPFVIRFGPKEYLDQVTLDSEQFYELLRSSDEPPKTAQPAPRDFRRAYELIARSYAGAVSIHVPRVLSGTLQAAEHAARSAPVPVRPIDSKSASVGIGLVALEAARAAEEGLDLEGVVRRTEEAIERLTVVFCLDSLDYLIRGGRISRVKGFLGRAVGLKPILSTDGTGSLIVIGRAFAGQDVREATLRLVVERAAHLRHLKMAVAHAAAPETATWYVERLREVLRPDTLITTDVSPALGVHGGPGAAGIAFIGDPE